MEKIALQELCHLAIPASAHLVALTLLAVARKQWRKPAPGAAVFPRGAAAACVGPRRKERSILMAEIGYALSSEEQTPADLVQYARRAEESGFTFALISGHFHPWISRQGHSPFAWTVIGGHRPGGGDGRGDDARTLLSWRWNGEALNEHILGDRWPPHEIRQAQLEEAVQVIRQLWQGGSQTHHGRFYTVKDARIYTLPDPPPPIYVAASGQHAVAATGRIGDSLIGTTPEAQLLQQFDAAGGVGKPRYGQITVCWAKDEAAARRTAFEWWPNAAITGQLSQELPTPTFFEQASSMVREEDVAQTIICGPDPQRHVQAIKQYVDAGYDHVYVHQVGPDQEGFFQFYKAEVLPKFG